MSTTVQRPTRRSGVATVAMLALCVLAASLGTSAANVALPELTAWFGGGYGTTQWVVSVYVLAMTLGSLAAGRWGDALGRGRTLRVGLGLFAAASVIAAMSPSLGVLVAARAAQGLGAAAMITLPLAIARDAVDAKRTGTVMGLLGTATAAGTAAGPALGGLLTEFWGWPGVFAAMAPLPVLALVLGLFGDTAGGGQPGTAGTKEVGLGRAEKRVLALGASLNLVVGTVMMSTLVIGPYFLGGALGLSPAQIGLTMAAAPVTSIVAGTVAGRLVDRRDPARLVPLALACMVVGVASLATLPPLLGLAGYLVGTVSLAPGYQLFMAANNTQIMSSVPASRRGTASGLLGLSRNLGLLAGATVAGSLFAAISGPDAVVANLERGILVVFGLAAIALLVSAFVAKRFRG
ncbi:MFS transporter [Tessaracoccus caeni]|uniref:MFS transporter n=1 Tax=Tessaracoccus caeni TaxID=3031239 RepID=UPI0023DBE49F|nr:MFS transporter [Tessaracoccus caeni]MDF1489722.1 MFS transporter [Tessaracoccus caeni]